MIKQGIAYNIDLPWVLEIVQAQGEYIWDAQQKRYIDFTSGWNVANLGFNHPEITAAVLEQAKKNHYAPMWTSDPIHDHYASQLLAVLPASLNTICRATNGTEANEMAIKIARAATERKKIIGFKQAYHGQSLATMALSFSGESVKHIGPLPAEFIQLTFPAKSSIHEHNNQSLLSFYAELERTLERRDVAAIVVEACMVTGSGLAYVTHASFLHEVRRMTQKYGTLMILDEVGTGFSRCGALFAHELYDVVPDILTLAKSITNGAAAMGALVANNKLIEPVLPYINITSTFGWTPIACAAASAVLSIHQRDQVFVDAKKKGTWLLNELQKELADHPKVGNVQGIGMEIGITFINNLQERNADYEFTNKVVNTALASGLHVTCCGLNVIQLMPPLTIKERLLHEGVELLLHAIN